MPAMVCWSRHATAPPPNKGGVELPDHGLPHAPQRGQVRRQRGGARWVRSEAGLHAGHLLPGGEDAAPEPVPGAVPVEGEGGEWAVHPLPQPGHGAGAGCQPLRGAAGEWVPRGHLRAHHPHGRGPGQRVQPHLGRKLHLPHWSVPVCVCMCAWQGYTRTFAFAHFYVVRHSFFRLRT